MITIGFSHCIWILWVFLGKYPQIQGSNDYAWFLSSLTWGPAEQAGMWSIPTRLEHKILGPVGSEMCGMLVTTRWWWVVGCAACLSRLLWCLESPGTNLRSGLLTKNTSPHLCACNQATGPVNCFSGKDLTNESHWFFADQHVFSQNVDWTSTLLHLPGATDC